MCMLPLTVYHLFTDVVTFAYLHLRYLSLKTCWLPLLCPFVCSSMQTLFCKAIVVIVEHIKATLRRSATYTVLDTHEKGYHKCPTAKIDVSLSNSLEVRELRTSVSSAWAMFSTVVVQIVAMLEKQQATYTPLTREVSPMSCAHRHCGQLLYLFWS